MPSERQRGSKIDLILVLLLVIQLAVLVYLGLAPFSFSPQNRVAALHDPPGLQFNALGIAMSHTAIRGAERFPTESLSIHLLVEPDDEPRGGLGTIMTVAGESRTAPLIIAQWKNWLVIRVRDSARSSLGYWEIDAGGLDPGQTRLLTITSSPEAGTTIYVDGVATGDSRRRSIVARDEPFDGDLVLGCLGDGSAGWRGKLYGVAITNSVLEAEEIAAQHELVRRGRFEDLHERRDLVALYDFTRRDTSDDQLLFSTPNLSTGDSLGALEVPVVFAPPRPEVFGVPKLRDMKADWFLRDLLRNVAGFFPFGFVAALILMRNRNPRGNRVALQVALLGALLSLGIETVQIAIPVRKSSLVDLSINVVGTALGAVFALAFRRTPLGEKRI